MQAFIFFIFLRLMGFCLLGLEFWCMQIFFSLQHALLTRGGRILALIPTKNALADDDNAFDVDDEFYSRSIASSLERLNILDSDSETSTDENVRLTPVFQEV